MKISLSVLYLLFSSLVPIVGGDAHSIRKSSSYREARARGAEAVVRLDLSDENNLAVSNAAVNATFDMISYVNTSVGTTDAEGICMLRNMTRGNAITLCVSKAGYYQSSIKLSLASMTRPHEVANGKWLPDPMAVPMKLRRIHTRPHLVNFSAVLVVPAMKQWLGFDLKKGQFVKEDDSTSLADIEFLVEWDGLPPAESRLCKLRMRFPERGSGGYYAPLVTESIFPFSYRADESAEFEIRNLEVVNRAGDPHTTKFDFRENAELIIRSRCVFDKDNKLSSANYCSIRGVKISPSWDTSPTLRLVYAFNPVANDTNLEIPAQ